MPEIIRNILVTVRHFSPLKIVFGSQKGLLWHHRLSAISGSFITVYCMSLLFAPHGEMKFILTLFLLIGVALLTAPIVIRYRSGDISFLASTRQITGLPNVTTPVQFSDVSALELAASGTLCQLNIVLRSKARLNLFSGYPVYAAIRIASHLSDMIDAPVKNDKGHPVKKVKDNNWNLPCSFPSGKFPFHLILFGAAFGGAGAVVTFFQPQNTLLFDVIPKILFSPILAVSASAMLMTIYHKIGFLKAVWSLIGLVLLTNAVTIWSFVEPGMTVSGVLVLCTALFLLLKSVLDSVPLRVWLPVCLFVAFVGLLFTVFVSLSYHSFFSLTPARVNRILVKTTSVSEDIVTDPEHIQNILKTLQSAELYRFSEDIPSKKITLRCVHESGRMYYVKLHQEERGSRARIVFELSVSFFRWKLYLGKLSSSSGILAFHSTGSLYGFWPPGY
jgi:hypothetical protein